MGKLFIHIIFSVRRLVSTGKLSILQIVLALLLVTACKDPFTPDIKFKDTNFLVVDGYIHVGSKAVTEIRLSRTVPLTRANDGPVWETGATIQIEDDNSNFYTLSENAPGIYYSDSLDLSIDHQYRLNITTATESNYVSAFTEPLVASPIDSVTWNPVPSGGPFEAVEINAHSFISQTEAPYYQWVYEEVFERRMEWPSIYKWNPVKKKLELRDKDELGNMQLCYEHKFPSDLIVAPAAQFKGSNIKKRLLQFPVNDVRFHRVYSITVTQHAINREAYNYFRIMLKNTNSMGTFFDPQPSGLIGNIRNINSTEPVIGFVIASQSSTKRLIVKNSDVPWWNFQYDCPYYDPDARDAPNYFATGAYLPVLINGYTRATTLGCANCHWWGGDNIKPDYWPEDE